MIAFGSSDMTKAYVGSTEGSKAYLGDELVWGGSSPALPYDAEVEYIETDGSAYIDTRFNPNNNTSINFNIYVPTHTEKSFWVFGVRNGANVGQFAFLNDITGNKQWRFGNKSKQLSQYLTAGNYNFTNTKNILKINNTISLTATNNTFTCNYSLFLLTINLAGTPSSAMIPVGARIGSCKIWDNGTLARDFIPVRVGQVGYLYDNVSGNLFGNAGTGSFVLGNDVN